MAERSRKEVQRRLEKAAERITQAVIGGDHATLSDVFYDAALDGTDWPRHDGDQIEWEHEEYGYDCDDLAAVLYPILRPHFELKEN